MMDARTRLHSLSSVYVQVRTDEDMMGKSVSQSRLTKVHSSMCTLSWPNMNTAKRWEKEDGELGVDCRKCVLKGEK